MASESAVLDVHAVRMDETERLRAGLFWVACDAADLDCECTDSRIALSGGAGFGSRKSILGAGLPGSRSRNDDFENRPHQLSDRRSGAESRMDESGLKARLIVSCDVLETLRVRSIGASLDLRLECCDRGEA